MDKKKKVEGGAKKGGKLTEKEREIFFADFTLQMTTMVRLGQVKTGIRTFIWVFHMYAQA